MTDPTPTQPSGEAAGSAPGPDLARDLATIWQSELAALAADREALELMTAGLGALAAWTARHDSPRPGPDAPARAEAAAAASQPRDADIGRLHDRLDALERRVAGVSRGADPSRTSG